jgi:hypothetical protein
MCLLAEDRGTTPSSLMHVGYSARFFQRVQAHVLASAFGHQVSFVQAGLIVYLSGGAAGLLLDFIIFGYSIWHFSDQRLLSRVLQEALTYAWTVLFTQHGLIAPRTTY